MPLEQVPFTRLKYYADWSALTNRLRAPNRLAWVGYLRKLKEGKRKGRTGRFAGQPAGRAPTYVPKYARYMFRKSNLIGDEEPNGYVRIYDKMRYMVAIQDAFSRFIVHACLKEKPDSGFSNILTWYRVEDCFRKCFKSYGRPFEIVADRFFLSQNHNPKAKKELEDSCTLVTPDEHPAYIAPLERFFLAVHQEMRAELTQGNLKKYTHFYNFQRPHSALRGYTPACAWLTGSRETFETFAKNSEDENRRELFREIEGLFKMNYTRAALITLR